MYAPLTTYRHVTPVLIFLSLGLVVVLMLLGAAPPRTLILSWIIAGLLTVGIRHIVARFRLDGGASVKAFAIGWPLLTVVQSSVIFLFPSHFSNPSNLSTSLIPLLQQLAIITIISLQMSLWQRRVAIIKHLLLGLIIGLISTLHPHLILLVLLLPIAGYYMRCLSPRNLLSAITGTVLGIWFIYLILCILPLLGSKEGGIAAADQMIMAYSPLRLLSSSLQTLQTPQTLFSPWQLALLIYVVLLLLIHTLTSLAVDLGQSVRAGASIMMLSMISIAFIILLILDASHLSIHLVTLTLLLALLLTIHQANAHHPLVEWWILLIQLVGIALCLLPLFVII